MFTAALFVVGGDEGIPGPLSDGGGSRRDMEKAHEGGLGSCQHDRGEVPTVTKVRT